MFYVAGEVRLLLAKTHQHQKPSSELGKSGSVKSTELSETQSNYALALETQQILSGF